MKKRYRYLLLVGLAVLVVIGGALAYFTSQVSSQALVVGTGSIAIDMGQLSQSELANFLPGDLRSVEWSVTNIGTSPVNLKGRVDTVWHDPALNGNLLVTEIDVKKDGDWATLVADPTGISSEFFYSSTGTNNDLTSLAPGEVLPMRMQIKLDPQTTDEFQAQSGEASVHLAAKQTSGESTWPETY